MKLNFRDLKQQKFTIDAEPSDTILQVKEKIATEKGWEAPSQKLIYSGKILTDTNTVESYKIEEKGFIVCMVSKAKVAPAAKAPPATPQASSSTPAPPAAPQQSTTIPATSNAPATPSPAQPAQVPPAPGSGFGDPSAMMMGTRNENAIREMEAMGFGRVEIDRALRAAYYNPDRAIDYLLGGIPENILAEQRAQDQQRQQQAAQPQEGATSPTPAAADTIPDLTAPTEPAGADEVNLFDAAAQAAQGGGARGGGARGAAGAGAGAGAGGLGALGAALGAAGAGAGAGGQGQGANQVNMDFLRQSEQFQHLRRLVQQQPAMLEPILQQVADSNPQLAQMISQNSEAFLQLLSEDLNNDGAAPPGSVSVTQEEADAIERLQGLGFPRHRVIQAYFACDKNEELAANFLFEQPEDDDE